MPLFVMIAVVLAVLFSSLFIVGTASAAISAPVLNSTVKNQTVNLTWDAVANATNYKVYYSTDNVTFTLLGNTTKTYYVYTQPWNTTYYYYVIAANATAESAHSNVVKVTTPKAPASGAAGWMAGGIVIPVYMPFMWLGVFLIVSGILLIAYGRTGKKHRHWEGFGALAFMFGVLVALASVVLPYFHLL